MTRLSPAYIAIAAVLAIVAFAGAAETPAPDANVNLLPNAAFETARRDQPRGWRTQTWAGKAEFSHPTEGREGTRCVAVASTTGADAAWTTTVSLEPFAQYRLSGWIKTENVAGARGALLNLHGRDEATKAIVGSSDWTRVELTFETAEDDAVQINCLFGGWGQSTGKAWFDDLQLVRLRAAELAQPQIVIDATKVGEPISPLVYGQFIEHLGRCIYGGIWAEMLEDRKFYAAVGAAESPWKVLGDGKVEMLRDDAFVGQHTPYVTTKDCACSAGIVQGKLALRSGKKYVGYVWLAGPPKKAIETPVNVSLVWGEAPEQRQTVTLEQIPAEYKRYAFEFTAGGDSDDGRLEISARDYYRIGTASLMPADNVQGMRPDTLALLKELDSPIYRWPGGNFVSGYDWRDGIGDRDRRPPRKNPAWTGVEHNDFGLDEFMVFCRLLKTEPYIAVNSGLGDVKSAVDEVLYANAPADTPMGSQRARNGHAEPYKVKYWGIGNEMYGDWQLGHMSLEKYIAKNNEFYEAMKKADPTVELVAVGAVGAWSEGMMKHAANHMEVISEHFYCQERPGLYGHVRQIPDSIRRIAEAHRRYRQQFDSLRGKDIRIALDEWNYWYGPHVFGELGTRYFLKDGLGIAAGLNEYARQSDIYLMANYAQTVNVIGCIKTSKTSAAFETTGLVLKLYRRHFGQLPVATEAKPLLDAQAAWSTDRKTLTLAVVNPTLRAIEVPLTVKGAKLSAKATRWQMAGDPMAYNDPDQPPRISIEESTVEIANGRLTLAPCSVTLFAIPAEATAP
jgi:alpha-N-arabinofuranosidase